MGNCTSSDKTTSEKDESEPDIVKSDEDVILDLMKRDLNENIETFLVNNLLLSVQFFENYEEEIKELRKNPILDRELYLNNSLKGHQKHCVLPDTIFESVNKRVRFRPAHGPRKFQSQSLTAQRMFIFHDNVEAINKGETEPDYSILDGPVHRTYMERANNEGYVHLRRVEIIGVDGSKKKSGPTEEHVQETNSAPSQEEPPLTPSKPKPAPLNIPTKNIFNKNNPSPSPMKEVQFNFDAPVRKTSLKNRILRTHSNVQQSPKQSSPKLKPAVSFESISNGQIEEEEEYAYTTVTRLSTARPLEQVRGGKEISDVASLPNKCIISKRVKKPLQLDDDTDEEEDQFDERGRRKPPIVKKKIELFETKYYISSKEFFEHFGDVFEQIFGILGFSRSSQVEATSQGSIIYINFEQPDGLLIGYEVYPAVATSWPEIAFEWVNRTRNVIRIPRTDRARQWPKKKIVNKIENMHAAALPIGHIKKRGENENFELEWSLAFPNAERCLETWMTHSQMRCYLFVMTIYKTYMELPNPKLGLSPHHIRTVILWECEKDWTKFQEQNLGAKTLQVLKRLYDFLSKGNLPDYFIRNRNLLESTPSKFLLISQEKLHKIIENPFVHILVAMRNLRYTSGTFFPTLDLKKLYEIITTANATKLINPALANIINNNLVNQEPEPEPNQFQQNDRSMWENAREKERKKKVVDSDRKWKQKMRKQLEEKKRQDKENLTNQRKVSVDSINLQTRIRQTNFNGGNLEDLMRKRNLLEFFIMHFIDMSKKCIKYKAFYQMQIFLNHTEFLAKLLSLEPSGHIEAHKYQMDVRKLKEQCNKEVQQVPPKPPRRLSRQFSDHSHVQGAASDQPSNSSGSSFQFTSRPNSISEEVPKESTSPNEVSDGNLLKTIADIHQGVKIDIKDQNVKLEVDKCDRPKMKLPGADMNEITIDKEVITAEKEEITTKVDIAKTEYINGDLEIERDAVSNQKEEITIANGVELNNVVVLLKPIQVMKLESPFRDMKSKNVQFQDAEDSDDDCTDL